MDVYYRGIKITDTVLVISLCFAHEVNSDAQYCSDNKVYPHVIVGFKSAYLAQQVDAIYARESVLRVIIFILYSYKTKQNKTKQNKTKRTRTLNSR